MQVLFLLNEAPYSTDKNYNALRTAIHLQKQRKETKLVVYLMSDSVLCALPNQKTKQGYYNIGDMLKEIMINGGDVRLCTSCAETRGVDKIIEGGSLGNLTDLTTWMIASDRSFVY